jgi:hypothetical protein
VPCVVAVGTEKPDKAGMIGLFGLKQFIKKSVNGLESKLDWKLVILVPLLFE